MKKMPVQYRSVQNRKPARSFFDLSFSKKFDCDMGQLIPICELDCIPGDIFDIDNQVVVRLAPMVAPVMHEINLYVHFFFVPYRILWDAKTRESLSDTGDWESFITGGEDGEDASVLPRWNYSGAAAYSLADYFGYPLIANLGTYTPLDWQRRSYNMIYNFYYRDQNYISEVALNDTDLKIRAWEKDYFTSALPFQQRGVAPALPISGSTSAVWPAVQTAGTQQTAYYDDLFSVPRDVTTRAFMNNNTVDLSVASTFDIADLRLAFSIQKWLEANARSGARYPEFLGMHFNVSPKDERLQRPEYMGGNIVPILVSEVLQTSQTDTTPQGNLAGHGIGVGRQNVGKYHVKEFGIVMGILSIMPKALYQQGINRQWMRRTKYDYYFPEFANLSEQAIENGEIFVTENDDATNEDLFGFQGRYDEYRTMPSQVVAGMRDTFDYWHLSRQFPALPTLNQTFIECVPRKDCFAAPSVPSFFVSVGNIIKAFRPMPVIAQPGLIDH